MPGYRVRLTVASLAMAVELLSSPARAQLQTVGVGGLVLGPEDSPVASARVVVLDRLGAVVASVASGSDGRFVFGRLSPGDYWLGAESPSMRSSLQRLFVRATPSVNPTLRLVPHAQEKVEVTGSEAPPADVRVELAGA